jgi:peptidoglycan-associated lipoprotein
MREYHSGSQFMTRGAQMTKLGSVSILGAAFALAACSHARPVADAAAGAQPAAQPAAPQLSVEQKAPTPVVATPGAEGQSELDAALAALRDVSLYFAFDEATLTPQATDKLAKVGDVLQRHSGLSIRIEGNCDERGSEAYNIALGQRRADAAKKYLVRFGARPEQIQAISYGKERPKAPGHDETAWAQNRRDDLLPR